ncbi:MULTISPECIES: hypothetical protein [unclassified Adlercreutzia]|uniref:hypothetical protein n=1 Tax=unclassified Adlercreutzia TaxID=2636013 RepID=UPI0013EB5DCE|nr:MULTISPECIES: hypothetical protein [unclassified Adlercreutzia]
MARKIAVTLAVFALACACVLGAGAMAQGGPGAVAPRAVTPESACPATGCASGTCHGYDDVPEPDGVHEMVCPEAGCASVECHAWDTLRGRYHQASDASLNLWVVAPVVLVLALAFVVRKVR